MQNKAERFRHSIEDSPGPADYDPRKPENKKYLDPTPIPGKGRLYVCRTPYTLQASAPSIPTRLDENGYYIDEDDCLVKIPANLRDENIGPGSYDLPSVS